MKKLSLLLCSCILTILLVGCGSTKLSDNFDEDTVKKKAESIIELFTKDDFASITEMVLPDLQDKLSAEVLEQGKKQVMPDAGAFDSYTSESVISQTDPDSKEEYATCVVIAKYENQSVTFTFAFNKEMQITTMFLK